MRRHTIRAAFLSFAALETASAPSHRGLGFPEGPSEPWANFKILSVNTFVW